MDFITMGLIPDIAGIHRYDLMNLAGRKIEKLGIDGVLLSHTHSDHADYISFLHEDIPIYMGETCHTILKALEERSSRTIEIDTKLHAKTLQCKRKTSREKNRIFQTGDKFKIG